MVSKKQVGADLDNSKALSLAEVKQPQLPQLHGVLVLNKPKGFSSNHCLMQIKRLGQKKIGHGGTLDPMAEGVLLVLLGQATKLSSYLLKEGSKVYLGTLRLGESTDTWDCQGQVVSQGDWSGLSKDQVKEEIANWVKLKSQAVPPFSAAKLDGQPLYKLARKGTMIERSKDIEIAKVEVLDLELPSVSFRVTCSSGTYIRSLAHSLGMRLGCGAVLTGLTREFSYPFGLDVSCTLEEIFAEPGTLVRCLRPIREALPNWPALEVPDDFVALVKSGQNIPCTCLGREGDKASQAILMHRDCELAIVSKVLERQEWKVSRGLWN